MGGHIDISHFIRIYILGMKLNDITDGHFYIA